MTLRLSSVNRDGHFVKVHHLPPKVGDDPLDTELSPRCTCGWVGRSFYEWQDTAYLDLQAEIYSHVEGVKYEI